MSDHPSRPATGRPPDASSRPTEPGRRESVATGAEVVVEFPDARLLQSRGVSRFELALVCVLALAVLIPGIWTYTLVDPWETHYAEVGRRMLQDDDWVHTQWQNEGFRSKPVLTFWLIASSMKTLGVGDGGGYSGEMISGDLVVFAVRLPFALFGALGLVLLWWMLTRLCSRRMAWLGFLIVATTPFYAMVARQAITDIPMVTCLIGAVACFAMALYAGDEPIRPLWRIRPPRWLARRDGQRWNITGLHVFLALLVLFVGWQAIYYGVYFSRVPIARGIRFANPQIVLPATMLGGLFVFGVLLFVEPPRRLLMSTRGGLIGLGIRVLIRTLRPARTNRQLYMCWFYAFVGVAVLAKSGIGLGLVGVVCFLYLLLTGQWRLVFQVEIPRGILLVVLLVVPWHLAMWLVEGRRFISEYIIQHNLHRIGEGMHGPRGTSNFFISQLGVGMWPWVALLPAAVAGVFTQVTAQTREGRVRLLVGLWAIAAITVVSLSETKFHHYVLPAVPALGLLIAFWLEDVLSGRVRRVTLACVVGAAIVLLVMRDLMDEHELLIELFIYRYDRPWPLGDPWSVDLSDWFLGFGVVSASLVLLLPVRSLRRWALAGFGVTALVFSLWATNGYMSRAATHWGMRDAVRTYYAMRQVHGIDVRYHGARQLADEWADFSGPYEIRTVVPDALVVGQPMTVRIELADYHGRGVEETFELRGAVARIGDHRVVVDIPEAERAPLAPFIGKGRGLPRSPRPPWRQVNGDRLIAWQLYWRGENFWTGDEIWGLHPDTRTAFKETDNKAFLAYLKADDRDGRRYFVVTESGRANSLRTVLPTETAKQTYEILDTTSNKFTLLTFVL